MAAVAPTGRTTPADDRGVSIVGATGVALAVEATEITPGFTNFIALATEAGAWRLLAGSGDAALAARALKRTALRTERPSEAIVRAGGRAWLVPLPLNGRLVGCAVFLADHDRAMPVTEAAFLGTFASGAKSRSPHGQDDGGVCLIRRDELRW